jgi:hypothetical protein
LENSPLLNNHDKHPWMVYQYLMSLIEKMMNGMSKDLRDAYGVYREKDSEGHWILKNKVNSEPVKIQHLDHPACKASRTEASTTNGRLTAQSKASMIQQPYEHPVQLS